MKETLLGAALGCLAAAGVLWVTRLCLMAATYPSLYAIDHWVIYLSVVIGGGCGAVCGAVLRKNSQP
jgi:hypothetical protein